MVRLNSTLLGSPFDGSRLAGSRRSAAEDRARSSQRDLPPELRRAVQELTQNPANLLFCDTTDGLDMGSDSGFGQRFDPGFGIESEFPFSPPGFPSPPPFGGGFGSGMMPLIGLMHHLLDVLQQCMGGGPFSGMMPFSNSFGGSFNNPLSGLMEPPFDGLLGDNASGSWPAAGCLPWNMGAMTTSVKPPPLPPDLPSGGQNNRLDDLFNRLFSSSNNNNNGDAANPQNLFETIMRSFI